MFFGVVATKENIFKLFFSEPCGEQGCVLPSQEKKRKAGSQERHKYFAWTANDFVYLGH